MVGCNGKILNAAMKWQDKGIVPVITVSDESVFGPLFNFSHIRDVKQKQAIQYFTALIQRNCHEKKLFVSGIVTYH